MKSILKMKLLHTAVVVVCSVGLAASTAMAQQEAPPPPPDGQQQGPTPNMTMTRNPEQRLAKMQQRLHLSYEQTAQMKAIFAESQTKMEGLRSNSSLAPRDRHAQMKEMRQDMQAKMRGVLTPEQQRKFDDMRAKMQAKQKERRASSQGRDGAPAPMAPSAPQQ